MSKKLPFRQIPAREVIPGAQLFDGKIVEMVATSSNDNTVAIWVNGLPWRISGDRTLPVVNL